MYYSCQGVLTMKSKKRPNAGRKINEELVERVKELAASGHNNIEIARILKIHRTTVGRLLKRTDSDKFVKEARIRVVQEALKDHFADLCKTIERFKESIYVIQPRNAIIVDLNNSQQLTISVDRVSSKDLIVNVDKNANITDLYLSIEDELLFSCLVQHTRESQLWNAFKQWKQNYLQYILNLTEFYNLLKKEAEEKSGLKIVDENANMGLTKHYVRRMYDSLCDQTLFGYGGFSEGAYGITQVRNDLYRLTLAGLTIASAEEKEILAKCKQLHQSIITYYMESNNRPAELLSATEIYARLQDAKKEITSELGKMALKRTFHGKCDICPD